MTHKKLKEILHMNDIHDDVCFSSDFERKCVVFLDVDGVLNNASTRDIAPSGSVGIKDENLRQLKLLIDKTKADIVLTSDWRFDPEAVEYLNEKLSEYGLTVSDKTPASGDYEHRGKEIDEWVRQHPGVCSFAVIDDLCFPDFEKYGLSNRLVKTDDKYGLRIEDVEKAIHILTGI